MPSYQHIFTDGLDKILSVSTWLCHYGGKDTFVYYTNNKLKGYISEDDIDTLAQEGLLYLQNPQKIQQLFTDSDMVTQEVSNLQKTVDTLTSQSIQDLIPLFHQAANLLEKGYKLYFATEEFNTSLLDPDKDAALIDHIGKFRLAFIETNIQTTELLYILADRIGKQFGISEKDVQFLTHQEVEMLPHQSKSPKEIEERKQHFLIKRHEDLHLTYLYGQQARITYEALVSKKNLEGNTLTGMAASKGKIAGSVYILSLTDENIHEAIEKMPQGAVLVTESTQPDLILACKKASAIVTDEGGVLSHAAIVSRELGIPCVVGTRNATELLKNGQKVEVDGEKGIITLLE